MMPLIPIHKVGAKRTAPGGVPQKWFLDDRGRQLILDRYDGSSERITELQRLIGVPRIKITQWAHDMGLSNPVDRWTRKEVAYLRKNIRTMHLTDIAKNLGKSEKAVRRKSYSLNLALSGRGDGYTMVELMSGLGMKNHHTVEDWIKKGWLKGMKQTIGLSSKIWYFSDKAIRDFILAHPEQINQHKIDWMWVVDILAGDWGIGRLDESRFEERGRTNAKQQL